MNIKQLCAGHCFYIAGQALFCRFRKIVNLDSIVVVLCLEKGFYFIFLVYWTQNDVVSFTLPKFYTCALDNCIFLKLRDL